MQHARTPAPRPGRTSRLLCGLLAAGVLVACGAVAGTAAESDPDGADVVVPAEPADGADVAAAAPAAQDLEPYTDTIPGTLVTFEMVPVGGGSVAVEGPEGTRTERVEPFYIGRTEVTWDMFDVFMFSLDEEGTHPEADAVARPSEPYDVPDYGWGRSGYAAISITYHSAQAFAEWLSKKTGHTYRLPTEAEWVRAANLATGGQPLTREMLDRVAWHASNSDDQTHPVASLESDALGLHDLWGNVGEWVLTDYEAPMIRGGSFRDAPSALGPTAWAQQDADWTMRDPNLPRSTWWLTDGPFVGFRLVREP